MKINFKSILLALVLIATVGSIWYLESLKVGVGGGGEAKEVEHMSVAAKELLYDPAIEISNPSGYLNREPFLLEDLIGEKVIMVDFWTYSCINCQRTLPYLNAWYDKYKDAGFEIVAMHAPEFEFEKDPNNVLAAMEQFGIEYPVVQDNDKSTWQGYQNRYWPRKYLIDIDGYIVYDHIGEGGYEETEMKIQELLAERADKLGQSFDVENSTVQVDAKVSEAMTPEIYFGAARNSALGNGSPFAMGTLSFEAPETLLANTLYLDGSWNIENEFAKNQSEGARILLNYEAKNIYMVASAKEAVEVTVLVDGKEVKRFTVQADQLYDLVEHNKAEAHTLELIIQGTGLQAYTLTFG